MIFLQKCVAIARSVGLSAPTRRRFVSLNWSGAMLALSGVGSVFLVAGLGAADVADVVALRIFAYACWLYGLLGSWALLRPDGLEGYDLARLRGIVPHPMLASVGPLFTRLAWGMTFAGMPGVLVAVSLSDALPGWSSRLQLTLGCLLFVMSLSLILALLGSALRALSARRARLLLALLMLVPFFFSLWVAPFPNVIGAYLGAFDWLLSRGGSL